MATINWPSDLPQDILISGYQETPPDVTVRTEMEEGPDKIRRWGTANVREIQGQLILDETQLSSFDTFYNDTSYGGALRFNWKNPRTENSVEMRFTDQPKYMSLGNGEYRVQMRLEIMP